jgi:hypothetical protein
MTTDDHFTSAEIKLLYHAVRDYRVRGRLGNRSIPERYEPLEAKLASFVDETKTCAAQTYSAQSVTEELIDTNEAAAILDCTPQWVRRIHTELGGRDVGGRHAFPRQTVVDYAERKAGQQQ